MSVLATVLYTSVNIYQYIIRSVMYRVRGVLSGVTCSLVDNSYLSEHRVMNDFFQTVHRNTYTYIRQFLIPLQRLVCEKPLNKYYTVQIFYNMNDSSK